MFDERRLMAALALNGRNKRWLAEMLGINEATLYRKMKRNGDFSREEINKIIDLLGIKDPRKIFFASEVA